MAQGEGGREREGARAWRRLIGQEIKLGLGEMGKWEAEEGEAEKEGERESGSENAHKYAISHAGVDKKDPFIASPTPPLPLTHFLFFTARADSHAQPVGGGWFRLPHTLS